MTPQSYSHGTPPDVSGEGAPVDIRRRRLLFRANHRGTHENDLLVGGFVSARISGFSGAELEMLEAILELDDVPLTDWLCGRAPIPAEIDNELLRAMRRAALATDRHVPAIDPDRQGAAGGPDRQGAAGI